MKDIGALKNSHAQGRASPDKHLQIKIFLYYFSNLAILISFSKLVIKASRTLIIIGVLQFAVLAILPTSFFDSKTSETVVNDGKQDSRSKNIVVADAGFKAIDIDIRSGGKLVETSMSDLQLDVLEHYINNLKFCNRIVIDTLADLTNGFLPGSIRSWINILINITFRLFSVIGFILTVITPFIILLFVGLISFSLIKHRGSSTNDFMGYLSNGRLFFSGIMANSLVFDADGSPRFSVPNLVSIPKEFSSRLLKSETAKILQENNVWNKTIQSLLSFIVDRGETPAFIPESKDREYYYKNVNPITIEEFAKLGIKQILKLSNSLSIKDFVSKTDNANSSKEINSSTNKTKEKIEKISFENYAQMLEDSLARVLPKELKEELSSEQFKNLSVVMFLALCVGKILTSKNSGNSWSNSSMFPELSARAALHSIRDYFKEYKQEEQTHIRRAFVCCSRYSPISVTRQPLDMSKISFSLRQVGELLLTNPLKLNTTADEVELHGLLFILHTRWSEMFFSKIKSFDKETLSEALTINTKSLIVKISSLVKIFRTAADEATIIRAGALINQIHQQNLLRKRSAVVTQDETATISMKETLFDPPIGFSEMRKFSTDHHLSLEDLKYWSILKNVLSYYGWLSRRVGDSPVSSQTIYFYLIRNSNSLKRQASEKSNEKSGFMGKVGMVTLRGDRLFEKFGDVWSGRFTDVNDVIVVEKKERFEEALKR